MTLFVYEKYNGNIDFSEYDYIVDAMFGIGLSRNIEGRYAQIAEAVNEAGEKGSVVVAVDIASGINADNGQIMGVAVKADYTVTFGYKKTGIMFYPGATYSGNVEVVNAGFVPENVEVLNLIFHRDVHHFLLQQQILMKLKKQERQRL